MEAAPQDDPYLWLEDIDGERALSWVRAHNENTKARYEGTKLFQDIYRCTLEALDSQDKLIYPRLMGPLVYNFWRDAQHKRGILRCTQLEAYLSSDPHWQTILDVDQLAEDEEENWVYAGHHPLPPRYDRTLLRLSRGGSDAVVIREFDLSQGTFIQNGFSLPEAKSDVAWKDADTLYVGTNFGPGTLTNSGYPRQIKVWKRGQPLEQAHLLFEGSKDDLAVGVWVVRRTQESYDFITRALDFWNDEKFLVNGNEVKRLDLPTDAPLQGIYQGQALVALRSDWKRPEATYTQGSIISLPLRDLTCPPKPNDLNSSAPISQSAQAHVLFHSVDGGTVESVDSIAHQVLVTLTHNVRTQLFSYTFDGTRWTPKEVTAGVGGTTALANTSRVRDDYFSTHENFLSPTTLFYHDQNKKVQSLQSLPARFDTTGMTCQQFWATSKDGTLIPYDVIGKPGPEPQPTLLYGYGGFEVSLLPSYLSLAGPAWLKRGGLYVNANIRGGGEFGPSWHQAALRERRLRAFEDFEAVAEDLIHRGFTIPAQLGIHGRSNGGLLTGTMFTRRPDLFQAVIIGVPLLDMARYTKLLAGASWAAEYGDPDNPDDWAFIKTYSPYHTIDPQARYPVPLIYTSTKDDRVHPGHARKMTARLEELGFPVIYYENIEGGHAGAADNTQAAFITALNYAYLWDRLSGKVHN